MSILLTILLTTLAAALAIALVLLRPQPASAHCDTLDGPTATDGQLALETGDLNHALKWIQPEGEAAASVERRGDAGRPAHHGQDEAKIEELKVIELAEFTAFAGFLTKLQAHSLLDSTSVLFGSNLGNASAHQTANLPLILAGGGYKHGRHIAINKDQHVFSNLFVSLAQRMGVETDQFGFSTSTLDINQA
jgi:hypothetical protein